jgi:hypothetical protein
MFTATPPNWLGAKVANDGGSFFQAVIFRFGVMCILYIEGKMGLYLAAKGPCCYRPCF